MIQCERVVVLDRSDQPLDHGDAAVLTNSAEALLYTPAAAPSPESFIRELDALVGDQMQWQAELPAQRSSQNGPDRSGRWLLLEHGKSHDPPRVGAVRRLVQLPPAARDVGWRNSGGDLPHHGARLSSAAIRATQEVASWIALCQAGG